MAATIDLGPPSSEQSVVDKLFAAVVDGPLSQFEEMLEALNDVDVQRGDRKTTLLHVAVKLGKADWVEGLLGKGADPGVNSEDGVSPAKLAEDSAEGHPGDGDRQLIWRFIRMVQRRDRVRRGHPFASNAATAGNFQEMIDAVKESVKGLNAELPTFRSQVTAMTATVGEMKETVVARDEKLEGLHSVLKSSARQIKALEEKLNEKENNSS